MTFADDPTLTPPPQQMYFVPPNSNTVSVHQMRRVICVAKHLASDTCELVKSKARSLRLLFVRFFRLSTFDVCQLISSLRLNRAPLSDREHLALPKKKSFEYTYD